MGEYFNWVNVDKKEYLCPNDFGYGNKSHETRHKNNPVLRALHELLSSRWRGDRVIFLGDEGTIPSDTPVPVLQKLDNQAVSSDYFDFICENYRNVSCLFKEAETQVREEIRCYLEDLKRGHPCATINEYGIDLAAPYDGLFLQTGQSFRYVINQSKKIYYSLSETKILYKNGDLCDYADPLPMLMAYGRSVVSGVWLGDVIGVSDELPNGCALLTEIYFENGGRSVVNPKSKKVLPMSRIANDWQEEFTPLILMRGKKYFEEGNVRRIQRSGNVYIAQVAGTEDYEVEISMDEDDIEEMLCTCPYARDNNCKHMAAVLFALESEDVCVQELPPAKHPTIVSHVPMELPWLEAIDNLPEDVIRKELLKQADRDGRLKERLAVLYLGKLPEYQLQNWRASLQESAGEYTDRRGRINDEDAWEFLNELSNFLSAKLPLLFEVGSIMDTFQLIWIVMETALEWEIDDAYEQLQDLFQDCKDGLKKLWAKATEAQQEQMMQWYQEHRNEEWPGGVDHMDRVFRALDQPEPSVTEKRIVQYFGVTPHFLRDGAWVPFPRRSRLYYDFIEDTTAYKEVMPVIEEIIKETLGDRYGCFGSCHTIWHQQKQLLMEIYGIEWFSPAELNRHVCFD